MSIQRELKQSRPFASLTQEAAVALLRTADLVRRSVAAVVESHDITPQQYNVLRILRGAGDEGLPTLEIAVRMIEQTPGITRLLDRLEAKKLVRRRRCPSDRRQVLCWITEPGMALLDGLNAPLREVEETALGSLSSKELEQLLELLDRTRNGLHAVLLARREENNNEEKS